MNILLIDDDLPSIIPIIDFLNNYFEVSACDNGDMFFELLDKKDFDILVLDINMPKTSGLELCKKIKEIDRFKYIPVIFVTAFDDLDMMEESFLLDAVDYVVKPIKPKELKIRIDAHVKISKEQIKLRVKHLELNQEIESLTKDLINAKNEILCESTFENREDTFKQTNKRIERQKRNTEEFNAKFLKMQEKLELQKKLLENTKLRLSTY